MSLKENFGSLIKKTGAVTEIHNPFNEIIRSNSPSLNWIFGNTHGMPLGYTVAFWGPPKSGKTLIINDFISRLHLDDLDAMVVRFDTEMRSQLQKNMYNIDDNRLLTIETNDPVEIFDTIEKDITSEIQNKKKIKVIVIDSINAIRGRRSFKSQSIDDTNIGDLALTLQEGFQRIVPIIRRYKIALMCTVQARAEFDQIEKMRGKNTKPALPKGTHHLIEYIVKVEENQKKDSQIVDNEKTDMANKNAIIGHKIKAIMEHSSCSPKGRTAEFTIDYTKGIIKIGEEVATLATNQQVFNRPNNRTYEFEEHVFHSRDSLIDALENNIELRDRVINSLKQKDLNTIRL